MGLSTFGSFEAARSGLNTNQTALNTVNHNIANSGTPGYSRQAVVQSAKTPYTVPSLHMTNGAGQIGTGVKATEVIRYRDQFADLQYRKENKGLEEYSIKQNYYNQLELIFNEPDESALSSSIDDFWTSMQNFADHAEDTAARASLKEQSLKMTETVNSLAKQLKQLRMDADNEIETNVTRVNDILKKIRDYNQSIITIEVSGQNANDYRDERDMLLDELSGLVDMQYEEDEVGSCNVFIGGHLVASADMNASIRIVKEADPLYDGNNINKLVWSNLGTEVELNGGKIKGLIEVRDEIIPDYMDQLDNFSYTLATEINKIHETGYGLDGSTGVDFFVDGNGLNPTDKKHLSEKLTVNSVICNDVSKIAASSTPITVSGSSTTNEAYNDIARKMAEVCETKYNIGALTTTITDYYHSTVTTLGSASNRTSAMVENKQILIDGISDLRDSLSEVNEDDELLDMLRFQRSYASSARIITAFDEMLQTILSMGA